MQLCCLQSFDAMSFDALSSDNDVADFRARMTRRHAVEASGRLTFLEPFARRLDCRDLEARV